MTEDQMWRIAAGAVILVFLPVVTSLIKQAVGQWKRRRREGGSGVVQ
jgi:hypothetical protein